VGQLIVDGGARGGSQVVPESWIEDTIAGGDPAAWSAGNGVEYFPGLSVRYRNQWYVREGGDAPLLFGVGIHGQNLFVDRARQVVIAKVSSQAVPMDHARIALATRAAEAIRIALGDAPFARR
jgi:CubicO group peptidase (beta-lactamase class C family)